MKKNKIKLFLTLLIVVAGVALTLRFLANENQQTSELNWVDFARGVNAKEEKGLTITDVESRFGVALVREADFFDKTLWTCILDDGNLVCFLVRKDEKIESVSFNTRSGLDSIVSQISDS